MKTQVIAFIALFATASLAVADDATPSITVIGTAVTKVSPDILRWRLSLTSAGPEVGVLAEEHSELTVQVIDFLTQQRISAAKIQTSQLRLSENQVHRNQSWVKDGYAASTTVDFECDEVASYRDIWLGLSRIPRVMVASVEWDSSKRMEIQKRTRAEALKAAFVKAQEMADVLGSSVGEPIEVFEDVFINDGRRSPARVVQVASDETGSSDEVSRGFAPGGIPIFARVQVTFRLESRKAGQPGATDNPDDAQ